jgi:hypothetical protein
MYIRVCSVTVLPGHRLPVFPTQASHMYGTYVHTYTHTHNYTHPYRFRPRHVLIPCCLPGVRTAARRGRISVRPTRRGGLHPVRDCPRPACMTQEDGTPCDWAVPVIWLCRQIHQPILAHAPCMRRRDDQSLCVCQCTPHHHTHVCIVCIVVLWLHASQPFADPTEQHGTTASHCI